MSDSLIANSGTKIILRTDFPRDVEFASRLLHVDPKWLPRLPLGTGIARLATRYYQPLIFTFAEQPQKTTLITDDQVAIRFDQLGGTRNTREEKPETSTPTVSEQEHALLADIAKAPIAGITARYARLGWHAKTGNAVKDRIIEKGLATFENVTTATARIKILTLTPTGEEYLGEHGVTLPPGRRGGAAHEYWRATLKGVLEHHGYRVEFEHPIGEGRAVDLYGRKDDRNVYIEIETGKSNIGENVHKCEHLTGTVVFFFLTNELRAEWKDRVGNAVSIAPAELNTLKDYL